MAFPGGNDVSVQKRGILGLGIVHLFLVVMGAASIDVGAWKGFGFPLYLYSEITGANSGYGFFAPGVGSDLRATFEIKRADGTKGVDRLQRGKWKEADLRVTNIIGKFWEEVQNEERRRALTASWAGKILARHAGAREVKVKVESFEVPSMEDYRSGVRPNWESYYEATYALR